jgi:hypothetical protein
MSSRHAKTTVPSYSVRSFVVAQAPGRHGASGANPSDDAERGIDSERAWLISDTTHLARLVLFTTLI